MRPSLTILALTLAVAGCGGDDLILPKDGEPARITVVSSANPRRQVVGRELAESLVVEVTDPAGRPVANVEVLFVPPPDGVVKPSDRITTGGDGRAAVAYTLSTVAGEQKVEARAPIEPPTNAVATIPVQADPDVPQGLVEYPFQSGNQQSAQVSTVLPESLAVKAVDQFGNGVAGVEVTWEANGGAEVSPTRVTTGADGRATTALLLGDRLGTYEAVATAAALGGLAVPFTATAVPAELVLTVQPSAEAAAGVPLQQQPQIQLQDPFGAPFAQEGVRVSVQVAQGGGSLGGSTTATSDASGRVTFTDLELRGETGTRTLIFAAEGYTPVTSTEIVVQPGPPAADESSFSVPNGTAGEQTTITIRLRDEFGNRVPGAGGNLRVDISGGNSVSNVPVTEDGDGAYSAAYVPVRSGTDQIIVRFGDRELGGGAQESRVVPGPSDPSMTSAQVTREGVFFVRIDVFITVRDAQGNVVGRGGDDIRISANGSAPRSCAPLDQNEGTCVDNGDGTYIDAFVIIAGAVTVDITLNGTPISGSPFTP